MFHNFSPGSSKFSQPDLANPWLAGISVQELSHDDWVTKLVDNESSACFTQNESPSTVRALIDINDNREELRDV
jgi:hypothetical protein